MDSVIINGLYCLFQPNFLLDLCQMLEYKALNPGGCRRTSYGATFIESTAKGLANRRRICLAFQGATGF